MATGASRSLPLWSSLLGLLFWSLLGLSCGGGARDFAFGADEAERSDLLREGESRRGEGDGERDSCLRAEGLGEGLREREGEREGERLGDLEWLLDLERLCEGLRERDEGEREGLREAEGERETERERERLDPDAFRGEDCTGVR